MTAQTWLLDSLMTGPGTGLLARYVSRPHRPVIWTDVQPYDRLRAAVGRLRREPTAQCGH